MSANFQRVYKNETKKKIKITWYTFVVGITEGIDSNFLDNIGWTTDELAARYVKWLYEYARDNGYVD